MTNGQWSGMDNGETWPCIMRQWETEDLDNRGLGVTGDQSPGFGTIKGGGGGVRLALASLRWPLVGLG